MLHLFSQSTAHIPLPEQFTYPFHYTPHPLCIMAAEEVQAYIRTQEQWAEELHQGKMFGVLVVRTDTGETGYLAAFSGNLAGKNLHSFFVPPIYDLLQPGGFFKVEEKNISGINQRIKALEEDIDYLECKQHLVQKTEEAQRMLKTAREHLKAAKATRELRRKDIISEEEQAALVRESQYQKAEFKRLERHWKEQLAALQTRLDAFTIAIEDLKIERKTRSAALQQRLFEQFRLLNAHGEIKDLCEIFRFTAQKTPPAGAGECAAPKLLQYAYLHQLKPVAMAEFWWGDSPKAEIRKHGYYYPACKGKCGPILQHMLQGLNVEPNPLSADRHAATRLEILFEDEWLLVLNKPAGILSVPGKEATDSVYKRMAELYPEATGPMIVHRLDMATSGLLLVAKTKEVHRNLQAQFKNRTVKKRYVALLDGIISSDEGVIELPLCPDFADRPRQTVNKEHGKPAITRYEVLKRTAEQTYIAFYPLTGRTHQLRVHAAHPLGLNCPITGDELYGRKADRLYLHAESLRFTHPVTGEDICVEKEAAFEKKAGLDKAPLRPSFRLRKAGQQDITILHNLFEQSVRGTCVKDYTPEQVRAWVERANPARWQELFESDLHFIIAEENRTHQPCGFTSVDANGYLHSMFVHPSYQQQGIAYMLLREAEEYARSHGATSVHSEVSITARPFFEKQGYRVEKSQNVIVNEVTMTNFVMYKQF